jgi:hypothetical protein
MLRRDPNGDFYYRETGFFKKKRFFRFHTGELHAPAEYEEAQYNILLNYQLTKPFAVLYDSFKKKKWWMFRNEFYWEDENFSETEVTALILDKIQQKQRKIEKAIARMSSQELKNSVSRKPISDDVRTYVWQRDGGRCVKCGSQERLEYDHIIPVAKGGSDTSRNIQLLCEFCNRSKGANL